MKVTIHVVNHEIDKLVIQKGIRPGSYVICEHHGHPPSILPDDPPVSRRTCNFVRKILTEIRTTQFEEEDDYANMDVWNCQGGDFKRFCSYPLRFIATHKLEVLGLLETKIQVEAVGLNGGIWVLWQDTVQLNICFTCPEFVLVRVHKAFSRLWFFSIDYSSPNSSLKKLLWNDLKFQNLNP
ncbi:conserved hypothetical protein [Ricinus communis]|uniref:Uncharacterized protein n=1 Tax=Ricinus communis TaxID=3988 RepID=B9T834_RICCO|nr:conserved hypothetical protein [Ricinus communis]